MFIYIVVVSVIDIILGFETIAKRTSICASGVHSLLHEGLTISFSQSLFFFSISPFDSKSLPLRMFTELVHDLELAVIHVPWLVEALRVCLFEDPLRNSLVFYPKCQFFPSSVP